MGLIKWRDSFSTGVGQFDEDHKKLVDLIDTMYSVVREKADNEVAKQVCREVVSFARAHFAREESAMVAASYPELEAHKIEHARLQEKAKEFYERIEGNESRAVMEFYHFLREWLVTHIQECDQKYGPCLNGKQ